MKVRDLKIGDQIPNIGTVRSLIPAQGGNVYVVVEMPPSMATHTWDPNGEVDVIVDVRPNPDAPTEWEVLYMKAAEERNALRQQLWAIQRILHGDR